MPIDTPDWVRDAVFYQIFPDRFAPRARASPKPGPLEPWDAPPTDHGFKGGDLLGRRRAARRPRRPRGHRALPDPDLRVGLEPPLPHVRLPRGRPAARRRRGAARAARRGPRAGHAGRPRRRLQPRRARVLAVPPRRSRTAPTRRTATGSTSIRTVLRGAGRAQRPIPTAATPRPRAGARLPGLVGPAGPAQAQRREPAGARVPLRRRRALAPLRHRRLAAGRPGRDRRPGVLAGVPARAAGRSTPRRTSSARSGTTAPEWLAGDRFDALMNYPLGRPRSSASSAAGHLDQAVIERHDAVPADGPRARRAGVRARRLGALMAPYDPAVAAVQLNLLGSHDTPRAADRARRRPCAPSAWPTLLQLTLPGRAVHLLRRRDRHGRAATTPTAGAPTRADPTAGDREMRAFVEATPRPLAREHVALRRGEVRVLAAEGRTVYLREADGRDAVVASTPEIRRRSAGGPALRWRTPTAPRPAGSRRRDVDRRRRWPPAGAPSSLPGLSRAG